jgi:hypothetical protein
MTSRSIQLAAAVIVAGLAWAPRVAAHHSAASAYDATKTVQAQGTVTQVLLRNPHTFIFIESTDETGQKVQWQIEMQASATLFSQGWSRETVTFGMVLKVSGIPSRAPGSHGITNAQLSLPDGTPIGRPTASQN